MSKHVRREVIGNTSVEYTLVGSQWMVSSLTIHRVFKSDTTMDHSTMIRKFKERKGCEQDWHRCLDANYIVGISYQDSMNRTQEAYLLNKDAFLFYVLSMSGSKSAEFRWAFISKYNELDKLVERIASGDSPDPVLDAQTTLHKIANNFTDGSKYIDIGTFAQSATNVIEGFKMGRNEMMAILRDMKLVVKKDTTSGNRSSTLGNPFLKTLIHEATGASYVEVHEGNMDKLLEKVVQHLMTDEKYTKFRIRKKEYDMNDLEVVKGCDNTSITLNGNLVEEHMLGVGKLGMYKDIKQELTILDTHVQDKIKEAVIEYGLKDGYEVKYNDGETLVRNKGSLVWWTID